MAVKTNQEYHAIQQEIAFAADRDQGARRQDPRADARSRRADRRGEARRGRARRRAEGGRRRPQGDGAPSTRAAERRSSGSPPSARTLVGAIDHAGARASSSWSPRKRNGVAVAEARDGICTICHVRLRPQVFNTVLRNDEIIQCDSCNRILYFVPAPAAAAGAAPIRSPPTTADPTVRPTRRSSPTSTAAPAAIPGPAGFGVRVEQRGRHARRGIRRVDRRRHQQRRRISRRCSPRSSGRARTAITRCTCDPTRCCSCSRCSATTR